MTIPTTNLQFREEIMLLALKDEEGTTASGTRCAHAVGGAVLAELLMTGRIEVDGLHDATSDDREPLSAHGAMLTCTTQRRSKRLVWTADPTEVLPKMARAHRTLDLMQFQ